MKGTLLVLVLVAAALGGQLDLLVVYCEGGGGYTIPEFDDDLGYSSVTYMDGTYTLISQETCANYGCVFSWNNYQYVSGQGDAFGNYVTEDSGMVVLCIWGISQCYGKIITDPTLCPINGGGNQYSSVNLGTIYEPNHPIMDDVSSINGMYYWVSGSMESGALRIADNSAGTPLAAVNNYVSVAALNICPGSYKNWSGDGWTLMSNTIHFLIGSAPQPPYVDELDPDDGDSHVPGDTDIVFHCVEDGYFPVDADTIVFTVGDQSRRSGGKAVSSDSSSPSLYVAPRPTGEISGTLEINDDDWYDIICTFTPDEDLPADLITCTVDGCLADIVGNEMGEDFVWTFETEEIPKVEPTSWGAIKAEF
jgi:hypothetical protein